MARLVCPRCSTKFQPPVAGPAVCPSCGYSADVVPTANPYGAPMPTGVGGNATPYGGGFAVPAPMPVARRNGLAIASLVTGIVGVIVWLLAPLALTLGIVALRQIRRDRNAGTGMAVTGIVFGSLVVAFFVLAFTVWLLDDVFGVL